MTPNQTNHIMLVYNMYEKEPQRSRLTKRGKLAIAVLLVLSGLASMAQTHKWQDTLARHQRNIMHYNSLAMKDKRYIKLRDKEVVEYNKFVLKHKGQ